MRTDDEVLLAIRRRLPAQARLRIAWEMSLLARELSLARLRQARPGWSEERLRLELVRQFLPSDFDPPDRR